MRNGHGDEVDFEKYSAAALDPILETEAQRRQLESSVDPALLLDPSLERARQEQTRRSWFRKTSPAVTNERGQEEEEEESASEEESDDDDVAGVGYSKVEILTPDTPTADPGRSFSPVYATPVTVTGGGSKRREATKPSPESKRQQQQLSQNSGSSNGEKSPPMLSKKKPLPPTPPKKPRELQSSSRGNAGKFDSDDRERTDAQVTASEHEEGDGGGGGGGMGEEGGGGEGECESGYANFLVLKRGERGRSVSNPGPMKKPMPLPRNGKAGTLDRLDSTGRGFECSLPTDFKPTPCPRKPTSSPSSSSPKAPRSPKSQKPPVSAKPLLPKPSPPLTRAHPHTPSPPTKHSSLPDIPSVTVAADVLVLDRREENIGNDKPTQTSPVPPPRRRRKAKTTPTPRQPLSPIYSPTHASPVKTVAVPSDTGSSDLPDTSSESDHSHPRHKVLLSPSPVPRSPSPFGGGTSPVEWHEEQSRDSSLVAQRNSVPSVHSSVPPSPLDAASTYGYVGDRDPLPPVSSPYSTLTRPSPGHSGLSPLPTSSE